MKKLIYFIFTISLFHQFTFGQWVQQPEPVSTPMHNIDFVNRWTGWATGASSVILKTTDGGASWFSQSIDLIYPKNLRGLDMLDANTGYIAGWFETILKTTNGGTNWNIISNIPSNTGNTNNAVFFIDSQTGWICAAVGRILRTSNGGISWDTSYASNTLYDIQFINSLTGWTCGSATLYKTTDGGINWISAPILTTANLLSLHFINVNTGWVVSEQGRRIFRTTNAGVNWDTIAVLTGSSTDFLYSVHFVNSLTGWTGGSTSLLFKTTDGGFNWIRQTVPVSLFVGNFSFYNDSIGWATGGNQGVIIHTTNGGTYVGINPISWNIPESFKLYQNYPNPFNPVTKIKFQITNQEIISLKIYDLLGLEVTILVNEKLSPGVYETSFDGNNLASGIYYYTLQTEKFTETKKMILIR